MTPRWSARLLVTILSYVNDNSTSMSKTDAMDYEYLVRRAHQVGRSWSKGADADIYRKLERSHGHFVSETELARLGQPKRWNKPLPELESEYKSNLREVVSNVDGAIAEALRRFNVSFTELQRNSLLAYRSQLINPSFEELEAVIAQAQSVMVEAGIFPK